MTQMDADKLNNQHRFIIYYRGDGGNWMPLDLSSLRKALLYLGGALEFAASAKAAALSETERDVIRAGVIQNFEFTYELSWKFIRSEWTSLTGTDAPQSSEK